MMLRKIGERLFGRHLGAVGQAAVVDQLLDVAVDERPVAHRAVGLVERPAILVARQHRPERVDGALEVAQFVGQLLAGGVDLRHVAAVGGDQEAAFGALHAAGVARHGEGEFEAPGVLLRRGVKFTFERRGNPPGFATGAQEEDDHRANARIELLSDRPRAPHRVYLRRSVLERSGPSSPVRTSTPRILTASHLQSAGVCVS